MKKEKMMRFSVEQVAEWRSICEKINGYNNLISMPRQLDHLGGVINVMLPDLNPDKVALEQLYSDTDIKREKSATLQLLVRIERLIFETQRKFIDMDKYTQMALKIDPEDAHFNFRNEIIFRSPLLNLAEH